jgi:hypothetical protein
MGAVQERIENAANKKAATTAQGRKVTDAELLVQWMTHRGRGRWDSFKDAVELAYSEEENPPGPYAITDVLSMLGMVEFFVDQTSKWRVFSPMLGGLSLGDAILLGGRTPDITDALKAACKAEGAVLTSEVIRWSLRQYRVSASSDEQLDRVAVQSGLPFVPNVAEGPTRA